MLLLLSLFPWTNQSECHHLTNTGPRRCWRNIQWKCPYPARSPRIGNDNDSSIMDTLVISRRMFSNHLYQVRLVGAMHWSNRTTLIPFHLHHLPNPVLIGQCIEMLLVGPFTMDLLMLHWSLLYLFRIRNYDNNRIANNKPTGLRRFLPDKVPTPRPEVCSVPSFLVPTNLTFLMANSLTVTKRNKNVAVPPLEMLFDAYPCVTCI